MNVISLFTCSSCSVFYLCTKLYLTQKMKLNKMSSVLCHFFFGTMKAELGRAPTACANEVKLL